MRAFAGGPDDALAEFRPGHPHDFPRLDVAHTAGSGQEGVAATRRAFPETRFPFAGRREKPGSGPDGGAGR